VMIFFCRCLIDIRHYLQLGNVRSLREEKRGKDKPWGSYWWKWHLSRCSRALMHSGKSPSRRLSLWLGVCVAKIPSDI
jgi:hypothetical protein